MTASTDFVKHSLGTGHNSQRSLRLADEVFVGDGWVGMGPVPEVLTAGQSDTAWDTAIGIQIVTWFVGKLVVA